MEALDLLQLHCPPTEVYYMPEVFGILDDLTAAGETEPDEVTGFIPRSVLDAWASGQQ